MESAALFVHLLNVCRDSIRFPLRSLFTRTEQHLSQPRRAHLLYAEKGPAHVVFFSPCWLWHLLFVRPCFGTSLLVGKQAEVCGIAQLCSTSYRLPLVIGWKLLRNKLPPHLSLLVALNSLLKSLREPFGSSGICLHAHRGKASVFSRGMNGRF